VAVEYDGAGHRTRDQQAWDVTRDAELGEIGWTVIRVVGDQLTHEPGEVARWVLAALARR